MSKRVVFDTNVLLSALIRADTPPALAVDRAIQSCVLLTAPACFEELQNKVHKPKFARYFSREEADLFLETYLLVVEMQTITTPIVVCRDPNDDKFLEAAVAGKADCLVTGDPDLLELHPFRGISIITPREFLDLQ